MNVSSINGRIGFPLNCAYVSSKFALEGLSESMALEIEQFCIKSILIEPGLIKTDSDNNLKIGKSVSSNPNSPYAEITQERLSGFKARFEQGSSAIEVAKVILKAITQKTHQN